MERYLVCYVLTCHCPNQFQEKYEQLIGCFADVTSTAFLYYFFFSMNTEDLLKSVRDQISELELEKLPIPPKRLEKDFRTLRRIANGMEPLKGSSNHHGNFRAKIDDTKRYLKMFFDPDQAEKYDGGQQAIRDEAISHLDRAAIDLEQYERNAKGQS